MPVQSRFGARGPIARYDNLVVTETADEVLLYDTAKHHIHHLNATTAAVWRHADGTRDIEDLSRFAGQDLGTVVDDATVCFALTRLDDAGLLVEPLPAELRISRMSRRTFMRRAGVAGAIAVPAVVSMTSPAAAQNFSTGCGVGCTPLALECLVSGYDCWVCFPTSFRTGYCIDPFGGNRAAARGAGPSEEQAAALERQYLIDEGYLEDADEVGSEGDTSGDETVTGDDGSGASGTASGDTGGQAVGGDGDEEGSLDDTTGEDTDAEGEAGDSETTEPDQ